MGRTGSWDPLSHGQEALWFLWKLVPQTWAYNIVLPVAVRGPLDASAFRRSLQQLSDRHPSLRTEFREEAGKAAQRSIELHRVSLQEIDVADWSDGALDEALLARAREPFDLERDATFRAILFRRDSEHHVLLFVVHHIVSDLWSLIVLMDELRQLYTAEKSGSASPLPSLPAITYGDYVREQRQWLDGEAGDTLWRHWHTTLLDHPIDRQADSQIGSPGGELPVLDLPTDRPRPAMQSFRGGTVTRRIDAELTRALKQLAGRERVTPFMLLLAAYQILLSRYSGQEQFFVGSPTSGRERAELQGLVGDFVNMVPLRADLAGDPTFRDLLARVRANVVATIKHQDYPFSLLVDRIHPTRDLSRSPIFQTTFVLQKFHRFQELSRVMLPAEDEPTIPFGDLVLEPIALAQQDGQFDVNLEMKEDDAGRLIGAWKYAADLFDATTIGQMADQFATLLADLVVHPDRPISELRLLDPGASRRVIAEGHGADVALPDLVSVCELFEAQATRRPDDVAVTCGDDSLTYAELLVRMHALARALVQRGVGGGDVVAVMLPRGLDFITTLLAVSRAGAAFLPLDVRHPMSRTLQIVDESAAVLVVTTKSSADALRGKARVATFAQLISERSDASLPAIQANDLAYLMFTSGSTGKPKGVMVEHRGMVNHVLAKLSDLGMGADSVLSQNGPPTFDIVVWQCLAPLVVGGRVVVFPAEVAEDPARLLDEVERCGVTVLQVVPSMLHALIEEAASRCDTTPRLSQLRWMVPTGEALPTALCRRWLELFPHIPLLNTYGSTECSDDQCHYQLYALAAADEAVAVTSIGTPIPNMTAYVLDEHLAPVPVGVVGELYIGGTGVGRGYVNDPVRTATSFVPDPFADRPGARLYRTRDLARRRADGKLDFLGRTDNVIKLRGFRIEPGEIEAALGRHPAISAAAVVLRANPAGERMLVGYLVVAKLSPDVPLPGADELRQFLADRLPQYMVPTTFTFLPALPLTANGKLDQRGLPMPEWQVAAEEDLVAPRTATEETLARIWAEVLGVERVGVTQDFFSIGGDSIRSIQIVARCKKADLHLRPSDLFQHSTIAALALLADREANAEPQAHAAAALDSVQIDPEHLALALGQVAFDE